MKEMASLQRCIFNFKTKMFDNTIRTQKELSALKLAVLWKTTYVWIASNCPIHIWPEHNNSNVCGGVLELYNPLLVFQLYVTRICMNACICTVSFMHVFPAVYDQSFPVQFILNPGHVEYELGVLMMGNIPNPNEVQTHDTFFTGWDH